MMDLLDRLNLQTALGTYFAVSSLLWSGHFKGSFGRVNGTLEYNLSQLKINSGLLSMPELKTAGTGTVQTPCQPRKPLLNLTIPRLARIDSKRRMFYRYHDTRK